MNDLATSAFSIEETCMMQARLFALARSKDPNTKVGACVYDCSNGSMYLGYNSLPQGFVDLAAIYAARRDTIAWFGAEITKYDLIIHAEENAIRKARDAKVNMEKCILFVTHRPCHKCLIHHILPSKIMTVVYADKYPADKIAEAVELASKDRLSCSHNGGTVNDIDLKLRKLLT